MTKRPGYTLVELLVVVMIISLLFGVGINAIVRSQGTFLFNGAIQQVQSMVREARSLAVTGKSILDYTDYDEDGLIDTDGDRVTPAHYGVHFDPSTRIMTLFADLQPGPEIPAYSGTIGVYDPPMAGTDIYTYDTNDNADMILSTYEVPDSLDLLAEDALSYGTTTVMYTPIFADTAFADDTTDLDLGSGFFIFGLKENDGDRRLCYAIHPIAGTPETTDATNTTTMCQSL